MKGLKKAAQLSNSRSSVELYYSIEKDTVYTERGANREFVTWLIRPNTPEEIKAAVERWLRM